LDSFTTPKTGFDQVMEIPMKFTAVHNKQRQLLQSEEMRQLTIFGGMVNVGGERCRESWDGSN
jgi:hypothetical protein